MRDDDDMRRAREASRAWEAANEHAARIARFLAEHPGVFERLCEQISCGAAVPFVVGVEEDDAFRQVVHLIRGGVKGLDLA